MSVAGAGRQRLLAPSPLQALKRREVRILAALWLLGGHGAGNAKQKIAAQGYRLFKEQAHRIPRVVRDCVLKNYFENVIAPGHRIQDAGIM